MHRDISDLNKGKLNLDILNKYIYILNILN